METGQTIAGKYRLKRLLGTGGMASVWSATNVFTERDFAIKLMLPQLARTPEAAQRFLLEAKISARIDHPNIIDVIDVGQAEDGSLFLVMELLSGVSLDVAIRRQGNPMSVHEFMGFMRDVAVALAAAHRSGVIHRDLKPTNVFLHKDRDGRLVPKVLDFGVSKILEEEQNTALTIAGTVLGSPHYMSPEQAMGAAGIDGRTDVFAFGGILFEALTGRRAYEGPNFNALIVTIATQEPERIDDAAPHLPEALRALVRECMLTDKRARLVSFDLIVERLNAMMPELERSSVRLPALSRASEQAPTKRFSTPSSSTKPTDATLSGMHAVGTFVRGLPPRTLALAVGVLVLFAVVVTAAVTRRGRAASASYGASALHPPGAAAEPRAVAPPVSTASATSDVPIISVDSLPVASRTAAKRNARLSITAGPGWCSVSVDGVARGVTPVTGFELTAGAHRVDCVPPVGKAQSATISVPDGGAAHHAFNVEE
ncbi:MAG: serine/threonine protein kinase [Myxococcota bacterium]|nr:serine/threonine protein kinase [Myxococcota bacterium]